MTELLSAPARTATGWFLALCGPLETATDADGHITARADYLQPPDLPAQALEALALEALHQISCRLAALARGAERCVPARLVEFRAVDAVDAVDVGESGAPAEQGVLRARLLRSGLLSTVAASLVHGSTTYHATVCAQEIRGR
ncbi:hypothetical protein [Kitasatospora sp. GAS204B]|uniref:hypothetical protein n=1 Tax=unclassified Kitasatospora TaxID=2633591 RepID=UPI00247375E1|nr:hypothetical protein [Kitasatospora sp. GAS204B]MDH6117268.1 hypothetical protein [Kitasatospora sp. GAS204B]